MDLLPIELLDIIASHDISVYYGLLGYKFFTDSLTPSKRVDFMIIFGHSVIITRNKIRWLLNGKKHRIGGPACEYHDGDKERISVRFPENKRDSPDWLKKWYVNGRKHRDDGPAVEYSSGNKYWYLNGLLHKADGPAEEWFDGDKRWYVDCFRENKTWYLNGKTHRDNNLPACEYSCGTKEWYFRGKLHRINGPAFLCSDGRGHYYIDGKLHRVDGPAIEYYGGGKEWYLNGEFIKAE